MTSMTDGIRLEKLADHYRSRAENTAEYERECNRVEKGRRLVCDAKCGRSVFGGGMCPDCLRLVADTLRDAAGRADK